MQTRTQSFTVTFPGISHVLHSEVHISKAFDLQYAPKPINPERRGAIKFSAIWDTGATGSVITQRVIDECGLQPIGMKMVSTPSGESLTTAYFASIFLPNRVFFPQVEVLRGDIAGDDEVLIGMDIITRGDFAVSHKDGKTKFSFRWPSVANIDFVEESRRVREPLPPRALRKVGRNDPCPCGSGKKYKYCCGR